MVFSNNLRKSVKTLKKLAFLDACRCVCTWIAQYSYDFSDREADAPGLALGFRIAHAAEPRKLSRFHPSDYSPQAMRLLNAAAARASPGPQGTDAAPDT
jgi:hypothetical protein